MQTPENGVKGRIHSFLSMGAVDGPGLRYVVFLQGCPLRCACCHNPDTWDAAGGTEYTVEDVLRRVRRCKPYIYESGGVTVTGGEPLAQPVFTAALLKALRAEGYHTALDTSGAGALAAAREVLAHTDLVLADLKFSSEEGYRPYGRQPGPYAGFSGADTRAGRAAVGAARGDPRLDGRRGTYPRIGAHGRTVP